VSVAAPSQWTPAAKGWHPASVQIILKAAQYLWRRGRGHREKAARSSTALRGGVHFLFRGMIAFWQA